MKRYILTKTQLFFAEYLSKNKNKYFIQIKLNSIYSAGKIQKNSKHQKRFHVKSRDFHVKSRKIHVKPQNYFKIILKSRENHAIWLVVGIWFNFFSFFFHVDAMGRLYFDSKFRKKVYVF
jgi:hypothetical protein